MIEKLLNGRGGYLDEGGDEKEEDFNWVIGNVTTTKNPNIRSILFWSSFSPIFFLHLYFHLAENKANEL